MNKKLEEAWTTICHYNEEIIHDMGSEYVENPLKEEIDIVNNALLELKAIKEANPSEALECLEEIENYCEWSEFNSCLSHDFPKEYNTIKRALIKAQEQEKVLEIIKKKNVEMALFNDSKTVEDYNFNRNWGAKELTQQEFDLLKEMIK